MKAGDKVVRINRDNFPACKVGDVGVVCSDSEYSLKYFGPVEDLAKKDLILVSFYGGKPAPCLIKYMQKIND